MELDTIILPIGALILSAFAWTLSGYFKEWRKNHSNPDWKGFNLKSLRNDIVLGAVLGVSSVVFTIFTDGTFAPITDPQGFLVAIGAGFGVVAAVDKFIIGGLFGK